LIPAIKACDNQRGMWLWFSFNFSLQKFMKERVENEGLKEGLFISVA
jgi:hypothetical protein